jgi:hypothetical protein
MLTLEPYRPIALVGAGILLLASSSAHAQGLFEMLFGAPQVHRPPPPVIYYVPQPQYEGLRPVEPMPEPNRRVPDIAFTRPPVMPTKAKPARAMSDKELVSSVLSDRTLERGDIVVFPDGPKVFRGRGGAPHRPSDFEDLGQSRLVSKSTRQTVLARTGTTDAPITVAEDDRRRGTGRSADVRDVATTGSIGRKR